MKRFLLIIAAAFSLAAYANSENAPQTTDGAFTTLMIAAADIGKYTETLRNNPSAFQATGTTGAAAAVIPGCSLSFLPLPLPLLSFSLPVTVVFLHLGNLCFILSAP